MVAQNELDNIKTSASMYRVYICRAYSLLWKRKNVLCRIQIYSSSSNIDRYSLKRINALKILIAEQYRDRARHYYILRSAQLAPRRARVLFQPLYEYKYTRRSKQEGWPVLSQVDEAQVNIYCRADVNRVSTFLVNSIRVYFIQLTANYKIVHTQKSILPFSVSARFCQFECKISLCQESYYSLRVHINSRLHGPLIPAYWGISDALYTHSLSIALLT